MNDQSVTHHIVHSLIQRNDRIIDLDRSLTLCINFDVSKVASMTRFRTVFRRAVIMSARIKVATGRHKIRPIALTKLVDMEPPRPIRLKSANLTPNLHAISRLRKRNLSQ